jgi:hypothetical protein
MLEGTEPEITVGLWKVYKAEAVELVNDVEKIPCHIFSNLYSYKVRTRQPQHQLRKMAFGIETLVSETLVSKTLMQAAYSCIIVTC